MATNIVLQIEGAVDDAALAYVAEKLARIGVAGFSWHFGPDESVEVTCRVRAEDNALPAAERLADSVGASLTYLD